MGMEELQSHDYSQYGIDWSGPVPSSDDENTVVVPELPTLSDDETELLQALTNLVAEATPEDTWRSKYTVARTFLESSSSQ